MPQNLQKRTLYLGQSRVSGQIQERFLKLLISDFCSQYWGYRNGPSDSIVALKKIPRQCWMYYKLMFMLRVTRRWKSGFCFIFKFNIFYCPNKSFLLQRLHGFFCNSYGIIFISVFRNWKKLPTSHNNMPTGYGIDNYSTAIWRLAS